MIKQINRRALLAATLATPWVSKLSYAQGDWPNRPIRWLVAFAAGGAADTAARALAADMQEALGQNIVIENRTGGNAIIAANALLQAPRDGYTFLVDAANQLTNPALMRDIPFDYATAFTPTTLISVFPQVIAVKHDFPAKDIKEFIAVAKARPSTITVGTPPASKNSSIRNLPLGIMLAITGTSLPNLSKSSNESGTPTRPAIASR